MQSDLQIQVKLGKYVKKESCSEYHQPLFFKYYVITSLITNVSSNVSRTQMTISGGTAKHESLMSLKDKQVSIIQNPTSYRVVVEAFTAITYHVDVIQIINCRRFRRFQKSTRHMPYSFIANILPNRTSVLSAKNTSPPNYFEMLP